MKFVASTGYLPVTNQAFENSMEQEIAQNDNINIQKLLRAAVTVHQEYDFYTPPVFDRFNQISEQFESDLQIAAAAARQRYLELVDTMPPAEAYAAATTGNLEAFIASH